MFDVYGDAMVIVLHQWDHCEAAEGKLRERKKS